MATGGQAHQPPEESTVVVVTGAAGGIGRAVVDELAGPGRYVVGVDLAAHGSPPPTYQHIRGDVTDEATMRAAFDAAACGARLTGLVTCAFAEERAVLSEVDPARFRHTLEVLLVGAWRWSAAFVERLDGRAGAVVHVGSVHALRTAERFGPYAAAKAGLASVTRTSAIEWGPLGVRCNAVLPGFVEVPRNRPTWEDPNRLAGITARTPLRRAVAPHEVASVIRFLLSADAAAVTGACVPVDGGVSARLGLGDPS